MAIHPQAVVDPAARLGTDVQVEAFAVIYADTEIGDGCRIGPHAVIHPYTRLGAGTRVHAGAVVGDVPQDLAFVEPTVSYTEIGEQCLIREGVTIHRGTKEGTVTRVGPRCYLMANCHLAHNVELAADVIVVSGALLGGYAVLEDRAFVSGNCTVHQFCRIGQLAMLGGGSAATKDVPPYCTLRSNAMNCVVGLNVVGMRRAGLSPAERKEVKAAFHHLYYSGLTLTQAIDELRGRYPEGAAASFWQFADRGTRGLCGADRKRAGDDD